METHSIENFWFCSQVSSLICRRDLKNIAENECCRLCRVPEKGYVALVRVSDLHGAFNSN